MIKKLVLIVAGTGIGVLACELVLRVVVPKTSFVRGFDYEVKLSTELFVRDEDFGFRPRLGSRMYDECGTRVVEGRDPKADTPGKRRILFLGDSATFRGAIPDAFREHFGDGEFAYWNAGVESFNTEQEVLFYKRFNHLVNPDHVILTFHPNDFMETPALFRESAGQLSVVFSTGTVPLSPWLHGKSYLYRLWVESRVKGLIRKNIEKGAVVVRESLRELRDLVARQGGRLTVLVLPLCRPLDDWNDVDRATHQRALRILRELKVPHIDLLPAMESAVSEGIEL